jgi:hypothetical protein
VSNLRKAVWLPREGYHSPVLRRIFRLTWDDGLAFGLAYDPRVRFAPEFRACPSRSGRFDVRTFPSSPR